MHNINTWQDWSWLTNDLATAGNWFSSRRLIESLFICSITHSICTIIFIANFMYLRHLAYMKWSFCYLYTNLHNFVYNRIYQFSHRAAPSLTHYVLSNCYTLHMYVQHKSYLLLAYNFVGDFLFHLLPPIDTTCESVPFSVFTTRFLRQLCKK